MSHALALRKPFASDERSAFRLHVLAGCQQLDVEELRQLADDIHELARDRRSRRSNVALYAAARYAEASRLA